MRSLNTDGFTASLVGLAVMVILLLLWGGWFFLVRVPLYESSQTAQLTGPQLVTAIFPAEALGDLQRGQAAFFYPAGQIWEQYGAIPAVVTTVTKDNQTGQLQVQLALQPVEDLPGPLAEDVGDVEEWLVRAIGVRGRLPVVVPERPQRSPDLGRRRVRA